MNRFFSLVLLAAAVAFAATTAGCASTQPNALTGDMTSTNINMRFPTLPPH